MSSPSSLSSVIPLLVFFGDEKAHKDHLRGVVSAIVATLSSIRLPLAALSPMLRTAFAEGRTESQQNEMSVSVPLKVINVSDLIGAVSLYEKFRPPNAPWFPHMAKPQIKRALYQISPCCRVRFIDISRAHRPSCHLRVPRISGLKVPWCYLRHGLPHGVGAVLAEICVLLDRLEWHGAASWIATAFNEPGFLPRYFSSPDEEARKLLALRAARKKRSDEGVKKSRVATGAKTKRRKVNDQVPQGSRPPHMPRLKDVKRFLRNVEPPRPELTRLPRDAFREDGLRPEFSTVALMHRGRVVERRVKDRCRPSEVMWILNVFSCASRCANARVRCCRP
jgi:hypothetical protein